MQDRGKSNSRARLTAMALSVSALALASPAMAQKAADATNVTEDNNEIVVTARKTNERLQDVPLSVSAISGDQLTRLGAVDIKDVLRSVPGLSFSNLERGQARYTIRGVGGDVDGPTVATFIDDMPLGVFAGNFQGPVDPVLIDIERVEVLKGPQGTLYGGSAMGGAIKYITVKPNLTTTEGSVGAGGATTRHGAGSYFGEAIINVPIVNDKLAFRGAFHYRHDGGFVDNVAGGTYEDIDFSSTPLPTYTPRIAASGATTSAKDINYADTFSARVSLLWQPDPTWEIRPSFVYQNYNLANPNQIFPHLGEYRTSYRFVSQASKDRESIYSLSIDKDLGGVRFTSLTQYMDRETHWDRDYTFFINSLLEFNFGTVANNESRADYPYDTKLFSQELRLSSDASSDSPFHWVAGLFYTKAKDVFSPSVRTFGGNSLLIPAFGITLGDLPYVSTVTRRIEQFAAFGEASYTILPGFDLTAGVRAFKIKQNYDQVNNGLLAGGASGSAGTSNKEGINPKFGASYKASKDNLLFVSAAKGFRPGGPNVGLVTSSCNQALAALGLSGKPESFEPDSVWTYEVGSKNQFGGGRATVNASAFYTDWKNIQQYVQLQCGFAFTSNLGAARIKGAELEARFDLSRAFQFGGTLAYTDAKLTQVASLGTKASVGDEITGVPRWTASAFATVTIPVSDDWNLRARGDYQYRSRQRRYYDKTEGALFPGGTVVQQPFPGQFQEGYDLANASLSLDNGRTSVRLYVNNIFDVKPELDYRPDATGATTVKVLRPRTIGIDLRQKF
jgi:iron complex outermembrane receptor protein